MTIPKLSSGPQRNIAPEGLRDGGHTVLSCSNCKAGLMNIWMTNPDAVDPFTKEPFNWLLKANCPWCGDESFVKKITGVYHPGGFGVPKPDDEDEVIPSTTWTGEFDEKDGVICFEIIRASTEAKPQFPRSQA